MIFLGPKKTETMLIIFFLIPNIVELIFLGSMDAILTFICIVWGYFMFMYRFTYIHRYRSDLIFLGCIEAEVIFLGCLKISLTVCVCAECPLGFLAGHHFV